MKKEVILILIILLFATYVYADCDVTATLDKGASKTYTAGGKDYTIKFSSLKNESGDILVKFEVNNVSTPYLEEIQKYSFSDLSEITVQGITLGRGSVNDSAQICFNAGLIGYGKGTCTSSKECADNNPCTIDECDGDPLRCHHKLILWCRNDDGCCPKPRCTEENDNDCKIIEKPINDSVKKNETPKNETPIFIKTIECESGDDYCPEDCTSTSDADCGECINDSDCDDNNACTSDSCSGYPKKCSNIASPGCDFNKECIAVGNRTGNQFCGTDNTMKPLKSKKEFCENNYECLTNKCIKNKCKTFSFFNKIVNWLVFRLFEWS